MKSSTALQSASDGCGAAQAPDASDGNASPVTSFSCPSERFAEHLCTGSGCRESFTFIKSMVRPIVSLLMGGVRLTLPQKDINALLAFFGG